MSAAALYTLLPPALALGPRWVLPVIMAITLCVLLVLRARRQYAVAHYLGHASTAIMTGFIAFSLVLLVCGIVKGSLPAIIMLRSSGVLWLMNVVVFALWYWRLDAGGPMARARRGNHDTGCFLFPQMMLRQSDRGAWNPHFIDYLFVAFNTSTAFSPTDTAILSRWAKVLVMLQSIISLGLVALVISRGINII